MSSSYTQWYTEHACRVLKLTLNIINKYNHWNLVVEIFPLKFSIKVNFYIELLHLIFNLSMKKSILGLSWSTHSFSKSNLRTWLTKLENTFWWGLSIGMKHKIYNAYKNTYNIWNRSKLIIINMITHIHMTKR